MWLLNSEYVATGGAYCYAIQIVKMNSVVLDNVHVANYRSAALVHGIYLNNYESFSANDLYGITERNCTVTGGFQTISDTTIFYPNNAGFPPFGIPNLFAITYEVRGFSVETRSHGLLMQNASATKISSVLTKLQDAGLIGFEPNTVAGYNVERVPGKILQNCVAEDIQTVGKVSLVEPDTLGNIVADFQAAGFFSETQTFYPGSTGQNAQFFSCSASNVTGFGDYVYTTGEASG